MDNRNENAKGQTFPAPEQAGEAVALIDDIRRRAADLDDTKLEPSDIDAIRGAAERLAAIAQARARSACFELQRGYTLGISQ